MGEPDAMASLIRSSLLNLALADSKSKSEDGISIFCGAGRGCGCGWPPEDVRAGRWPL